MAPVEYEGLKDHAGWRFTLVPQENAAGSPGYLLHQLAPSQAYLDWANQEPVNRLQPSVAAKTSFVTNPPDEWREEAWLREWLRGGWLRMVDGRDVK